MQLAAQDAYLAALHQQAGQRDGLLGAMAEQLAALQAACARQLEALDTLHTQVRGFMNVNDDSVIKEMMLSAPHAGALPKCPLREGAARMCTVWSAWEMQSAIEAAFAETFALCNAGGAGRAGGGPGRV